MGEGEEGGEGRSSSSSLKTTVLYDLTPVSRNCLLRSLIENSSLGLITRRSLSLTCLLLERPH